MQNISELFERYRDDVYRLAVSFTQNRQEAEDVCQTVFLKLLEQRNIEPGKEKNWLMQVTANQCRSLLRSSWWKKTAPMENAQIAQYPQTNEVLDSVLVLPPKYRVVVYLHYYEGMSAKEISKLLRISPSTVTTRLSRARMMLKESLKED